MGKHEYEFHLKEKELNKKRARISAFRDCIRENDIDYKISEEFPLSSYGKTTDLIRVEGSQVLMDRFYAINNKKYDTKEKLKDIEIIDFTEDNHLKLKILSSENSHAGHVDFHATGIYQFTSQFFETIFKMGSFKRFCLDNKFHQEFIDSARAIQKRLPEKEMQYRFIDVEGEWRARAITSPSYKNYDNHLAIYLTLLSLHQYAEEFSFMYKVKEAYISDSEVMIFIEQSHLSEVVGIGKIYFGLLLTNNEVKDKAFSLRFRYRIEDENGYEFAAVEPIDEAIFHVRHNTGIENVKRQLQNLRKLDDIRNRILAHITSISQAPYLSEDHIYHIFQSIIKSKKLFGKEVKEKAKELQSNQTVSNSMGIIEALHRINEVTKNAGLDEKTHLERIYFEALLSLKAKSSKKASQ